VEIFLSQKKTKPVGKSEQFNVRISLKKKGGRGSTWNEWKRRRERLKVESLKGNGKRVGLTLVLMETFSPEVQGRWKGGKKSETSEKARK